MLKMPVLDAAAQTYKVRLQDVEYAIRLRYNRRAESWYLDVGDRDGVWIVRGLRIVQGFPILGRHTRDGLPPGDFFFFYSPNGDDATGRDGFNDGGRFLYFTPGDQDELEAPEAATVTLVSVVDD